MVLQAKVRYQRALGVAWTVHPRRGWRTRLPKLGPNAPPLAGRASAEPMGLVQDYCAGDIRLSAARVDRLEALQAVYEQGLPR